MRILPRIRRFIPCHVLVLSISNCLQVAFRAIFAHSRAVQCSAVIEWWAIAICIEMCSSLLYEYYYIF